MSILWVLILRCDISEKFVVVVGYYSVFCYLEFLVDVNVFKLDYWLYVMWFFGGVFVYWIVVNVSCDDCEDVDM